MIDTSIIDFRRSIFEGRSSKVDTSISQGRHSDLRKSTHRSSIFEGRHIIHRSSKVDTSIFESRHIDHRRSTHRSSKIEGVNIAPTIRHRILSTTALHSIIESVDSIIESVDSISKDERRFPLTQYITNGRISCGRSTIVLYG